MRTNVRPWMAATFAPLLSERRRERFDQWYDFLEDESQKDNGLLCFYDRDKSREVAYFCGLLADCLTSSGEDSGEEDLGKFPDIGPMPDQGKSSFAPLKVASKA